MTALNNTAVLSQFLGCSSVVCVNTELSFGLQAAALVEEETRRYRPTKNYLSYLPTPDFAAFEVT